MELLVKALIKLKNASIDGAKPAFDKLVKSIEDVVPVTKKANDAISDTTEELKA
jgi:hypothetical protein